MQKPRVLAFIPQIRFLERSHVHWINITILNGLYSTENDMCVVLSLCDKLTCHKLTFCNDPNIPTLWQFMCLPLLTTSAVIIRRFSGDTRSIHRTAVEMWTGGVFRHQSVFCVPICLMRCKINVSQLNSIAWKNDMPLPAEGTSHLLVSYLDSATDVAYSILLQPASLTEWWGNQISVGWVRVMTGSACLL